MNREISSDKILRMRTVLERTGLSRSTVYRKVQEGTFPPKVIAIYSSSPPCTF